MINPYSSPRAECTSLVTPVAAVAAPVPHLGTGDGAIGRELLPQPLIIYPIIQVLHVQVDPLHTGGKKSSSESHSLQQFVTLDAHFTSSSAGGWDIPQTSPAGAVTWRGTRIVHKLHSKYKHPK